MPLKEYPKEAIDHARQGALDWLATETDGYPRSWEQETARDAEAGRTLYDDFEAPPIAGYEQLEREGLVVRLETGVWHGQERVHFRLANSRAISEKQND